MIIRLLAAALVAGLLAACAASLLQFALTSPLIARAETFERAPPAPHAHDGAAPHDHAGATAAEWEPGEGLPRAAFTALATLVSGVGYALVLGAALLLGAREPVGAEALRFALGGFLAFSLAPAVGLPPELPGIEAAALGARQAWWLGTALATAAGLYLAAVVRSRVAVAAGLALLAAPHVLGAPHPATLAASGLPPALASAFAARSLAVALVFWTVLGLGFGWAWRQADARGTAAQGAGAAA